MTFGQLQAAANERFDYCDADELLAVLFMLQGCAELERFVAVGQKSQPVSFERVRNTPQWKDFFTHGTFNIQVLPVGRRRFQELTKKLERNETQNRVVKRKDNMRSETTQNILLLISHSSKDKGLAEELIELFRLALGLRADQIRCTSVDGYRLPAGVNTDDQLRAEIKDVRAFIGLLTPNSIASTYVLFELGARWGAELSIFPLLAGIRPEGMRGPHSVLNMLSCESESQLLQFVEDVGKELNLSLQSPTAYLKHIKAAISLAESIPTAETQSDQFSKLQTEIDELKNQLAAKEEMEPFGPLNYFYRNNKTIGPYCPKCWQKDGKKVLLPASDDFAGGKGRICTVCNKFYIEEPKKDSQIMHPRIGKWS